MKHFSYLAAFLAALFCVQSVGAENLETVHSGVHYFSESSSSEVKTTTKKRLKSSLEFDYNFVDIKDYNNIGATFVFGGLVITGTYGYYNELPETFSSYRNWSIGTGINKRLYLFDFLFLEGRLVADYNVCDSGFVSESAVSPEPESVAKWDCYAGARAGLKLLDNTCVTVGYKWHLDEFKFAKKYMTEQLSVGLSFLF